MMITFRADCLVSGNHDQRPMSLFQNSRFGLACLGRFLCSVYMHSPQRSIAVIGGGPAGLRAAELAAAQGAAVTLYDHKRSVGRKFLIAGKSGLNLTNAAEFERFAAHYSGTDFPALKWRDYLQQFDNTALRNWAAELGVETFVAGGGKVFPVQKKAAPLLRRWVARLKAAGVVFEMNHQWCGVELENDRIGLCFNVKGDTVWARYDRVVLALGGASWPQTGSTGTWSQELQRHGIHVEPLVAANCGWECHWNLDTLAIAEGKPLHHLSLRAGEQIVSGELMVTRYGFEGTPMYHLGRQLRGMKQPILEIDFKPVFTHAHMVKKMESARRDFYREARLRWKFTDSMCAILKQYYGEFGSADALARAAKCCRIPLAGPRPIAEAISTAGGVSWAELDDRLMLKRLPGVYCAGEMIDWEAPTGGFLLQGCFVTGTIAGRAAGQW